MSVEKKVFGTTQDGQEVHLFRLTNANGLQAVIANYGATVVRLLVPDRDGKLDDIVLGYETLADYVADTIYAGPIVGRYGNRINKGRFKIGGVEYQLTVNDGENHLHGGKRGFDKAVWKAESFKNTDEVGVKLTHLSQDGDQGYPGNLKCTVCYSLTNDNALKIQYDAETDKATPVNLTHHGYFNLAGQGKCDILDHLLMLNADRFTPSNQELIPTGEILSVKGTPMDFTAPTAIGARISQDYIQLNYGKGYDCNWVLNRTDSKALSLAARVHERTTGRIMEVLTTEPGIQFYSGNFLDGTKTGKGGKVYKHRYGFCLETQHFPDSPNKPNFPSVILQPGQRYKHTTLFRFLAE